MTDKELKQFLDFKVEQYNHPEFIKHDPIQIPHLFTDSKDIAVMGFLVATIAWGNRKSIINNGNKLVELLHNEPHDFIINHTKKDLESLSNFVHRTFNSGDLVTFVQALKMLENKYNGLEGAFAKAYSNSSNLQEAIGGFKDLFFEIPHLKRAEKHVSDPRKNSAAKRINMFLRWMVRKDLKGVDFGIWDSIPMSSLSIPLDIHTGNIARQLGMLTRKQNDAKALVELNEILRELDPHDPVKYDFALFGIGAHENFKS